MNKNIFGISLVAILAIGAIVSVFIYENMSKRPNFGAEQVERGDISEEISLDGKVKSQEDADLGFERGGRIMKLTHKVGDFVAAGTVLAYANAADLKAQYNQAVDLARSSDADLEQYKELYKKEKSELASLKKSDTANSDDKKAQKKQIEASEAQVTSQQEKVSAAYANVENAKAQIDKTVIAAPFDGIVTKQDVSEGEVAQSNIPVITLSSQDLFKIEAYASEIDVAKLRIGDSAKVSLDDGSERNFSSQISAIDPAESEIGGVSNYKITLNIKGDVSDLRSGVGANISIESRKKTNVLLVPKGAVFSENGKSFVYFSQDGLRLKKEVEIGISGADGKTEITSGLVSGDQIFILKNNS